MTGQVDRLSYIIGLGSTFSTLRRFVEYEIKEYLIEHAGNDYSNRQATQFTEYLLDSIIYSILNQVYYKDESLPDYYVPQQIICGLYSQIASCLGTAPSVWEIEQIVNRIVDLPEYDYFFREMEMSRSIAGYDTYVGKIKINRYRSVAVTMFKRSHYA